MSASGHPSPDAAVRDAPILDAPGPDAPTLDALTRDRRIVVCCGSGGVGKTTVASAVALEGARSGRRTVVVTIDPARRLADALGLDGLSDRPARIGGDWPGELWATMLDTKSTFDALVRTHSVHPDQAERILANRFYRNISAALSGTQEYMAMEKLYELRQGSDFDLIVVDTPPTRHALDFLDAPGKLTGLLEHRLFRALVLPRRGVARAAHVAAQTFLRTVSKVVGAEVIDDAVAFFQAFEGMEQGFRERAERVRSLLGSPESAFVLVTSARRDTVEEARFFAERLGGAGLGVDCLVVNRVHPWLGDGDAEATRRRAAAFAGTTLARWYDDLAGLQTLAGAERQHLAGLAGAVAPAPVVWVPLLRHDVHDLAGVAEVASLLHERPPGGDPGAG